MRILLDTHIFLWYVTGDDRLASGLHAVLRDAENTLFLSVASTWEAVIKSALGKLPLPAPAEELFP